ncbi:hypothetical protein ACUN0C_19490 [Faunimonas sp. B44]|uniref:hypothetical protein n=1 Tax=Faunimonas sp. B44 TaxID=3461493 RepID=UPI004043BB37
MRRHLFLHIGSPKVASSSIQDFLFRNTHRLRQLGYEVASKDLTTGGHGGNPLWLLEDLYRAPDGAAQLSDRLRSASGHKIVISAENMGSVRASELFAPLSEEFTFNVLYMVRRQDDWIYSAWKQWQSKTGKTLEHYVRIALLEHTPDFVAIANAWRLLAGENLSIVSLDTTRTPLESVVSGWLGLEDEQAHSFEKSGPRSRNESFDFAILDILSRHSAVYQDVHDRRIEEFLSHRSRLASSRKFRLSDELSQEIMREFYDDNVALLGKEAADSLALANRADRHSAQSGADLLDQHDFTLAAVLEAMGEMAIELVHLRARLKRLEGQGAQPLDL